MDLTCIYEIRNIKLTLTKFRDSLSEKSDVIKSKTRILNDLRKIELAYIEYQSLCRYGSGVSANLEFVKDLIDVIKDMNDIESFVSLLSSLEDNIDVPEELEDWQIEEKYYNAIHDINDDTLLNPQILEMIGTKIKNNNRPIKIFDPRCKDGDNLKHIKNGCENSLLYGLEKNVGLAQEAKEYLDRVIKGSLFGSKISNNAFDVLFLMPDVSWETDFSSRGTLNERKERSAIRDTIKYLNDKGVFVYTIPYFRLSKEIAYMLSKLITDISIIKHSEYEDSNPYITIIGYKNVIKEPDEEYYQMLSTLNISDIRYNVDLKTYNINTTPADLVFFRGSVLDNDELQEIKTSSGLYDSFWEKQNPKNLIKDTRPLLPFNIGQIGLVLTSGCLDGIIEEYDGQYHAIKGMVVKAKRRTVENNEDNTEQTAKDTYTNIVQINIFSPDGEFIELA